MNENGIVNMMEPEERLQQRLEQLATGQPLEVCAQGLPENEVRLLRMAAALQTTQFPAADETAAANQRTRVLRAAGKSLTPAAPVTPPSFPWLDSLRTLLDWLLSRRELAAVLSAAFIIILLLTAGIGFSRWQGNRQLPAVVEEENPVVTNITAVNETAVPPAAAAVAAVATETPDHQVYIPLASYPLVLDAATVAVTVDHGLVEIQIDTETWTAVQNITTLKTGQRIRTGPLSSATLTFYDDSQAFLGPESELSIDELNAQRPENGFRTVVLTQWLGESEHSVAFRNDRGSRYEVKTPSGSGVARGTRFHVTVTTDLRSRFSVSEGRVDVTNANSTVSVIAGQLTTSTAGRAPDQPAFRISGEGVVAQTGAVWTIAGQTFQTDDRTIIIGNPQAGDLVRVDGHLQPDGGRVADNIVLLRRAVTNRFQLSGPVNEIGADAWTVAGQTIYINGETRRDDNIAINDTVQVDGVLQSDGSLLARQIRLTAAARPFTFTGVVQQMGTDIWRISGQAVHLDAAAVINAGLAAGDEVVVYGRIDDDVWLAQRIERITEPERRFAFTGRVQNTSPWLVAGVSFETRAWTVIAPGIAAGSRVRVQGIVLADGTWAADRIDLLNNNDNDGDDDGYVLVLIGIVNGVDPLIVNGIPLDIDSSDNGNNARLDDRITVNTLVQVQVRVGGNGRWVVTDIRVIHSSFGRGCLTVNSMVVGISAGQISLRHWPAISLANVRVDGSAAVNSVVTFSVCTGFDSTIRITNVIVIYESTVIVVPPASGNGNGNFNDNGNDNGGFNGNSNG